MESVPGVASNRGSESLVGSISETRSNRSGSPLNRRGSLGVASQRSKSVTFGQPSEDLVLPVSQDLPESTGFFSPASRSPESTGFFSPASRSRAQQAEEDARRLATLEKEFEQDQEQELAIEKLQSVRKAGASSRISNPGAVFRLTALAAAQQRGAVGLLQRDVEQDDTCSNIKCGGFKLKLKCTTTQRLGLCCFSSLAAAVYIATTTSVFIASPPSPPMMPEPPLYTAPAQS